MFAGPLLRRLGQKRLWSRPEGRTQNLFEGSPQASLIAQLVKNPPAVQETLVWFLCWEEPLEKGWATHSSILRLPFWLSWLKICLQCRRPEFDPLCGSQRVGHDWANFTFTFHFSAAPASGASLTVNSINSSTSVKLMEVGAETMVRTPLKKRSKNYLNLEIFPHIHKHTNTLQGPSGSVAEPSRGPGISRRVTGLWLGHSCLKPSGLRRSPPCLWLSHLHASLSFSVR